MKVNKVLDTEYHPTDNEEFMNDRQVPGEVESVLAVRQIWVGQHGQHGRMLCCEPE